MTSAEFIVEKPNQERGPKDAGGCNCRHDEYVENGSELRLEKRSLSFEDRRVRSTNMIY